jgi:molybdenum-dependent DNA-binding transcriptional regulator ModE
VKARVAQKPFTSKTTNGEKSFVPGSIVIPVHYQTVSPDELYNLLQEAVKLSSITVSAITDGFSIAGIDIGSNNIRVLKKPVVATVTGGVGYGGANWTSVGELWALLGNTLGIPLSKIDAQAFERADLSRYTAIVLTGATTFTPEFVVRLTDWVSRGGTLIATGSAVQWAISSKIATGLQADTTRTPGTPSGRFGGGLQGAILNAELNLEHPLAYGFTSKAFYTLKTTPGGLPRPVDPANLVLKTLSGDPVSGYVPSDIRPKLKDNPVVVSTSRGRGSVVLFGESPTFRGYYLAPGRLLTNALFFGAGGGGREY